MDCSRAGSTFSPERRSRISRDQSGMLGLRDAAHGLDERRPGAPLHPEHLPAARREAVIAATPLRGLLDPAALEEAAAFQAIQQGIQRRDVEAQGSARTCLDELADLVAVPGAVLDEGE